MGAARLRPTELHMKKVLFAAVALALSAPASAAFADDYGYRRDREHRREHRELEREHRHAHEHGFDSRRDHRAYHRELRREHRADHREARYRSDYGYSGRYGYGDDGHDAYRADPYGHRRW